VVQQRSFSNCTKQAGLPSCKQFCLHELSETCWYFSWVSNDLHWFTKFGSKCSVWLSTLKTKYSREAQITSNHAVVWMYFVRPKTPPSYPEMAVTFWAIHIRIWFKIRVFKHSRRLTVYKFHWLPKQFAVQRCRARFYPSRNRPAGQNHA